MEVTYMSAWLNAQPRYEALLSNPKSKSHFFDQLKNFILDIPPRNKRLLRFSKRQKLLLFLSIYGRFKGLGEEVTTNLYHRYEKSKVLKVFPELSFNPFVDRLFQIFSSKKDDKMSFEDILDLASAFSAKCPVHVKAKWAFLIFDFDGDQLLNKNDIVEIITRLTRSDDFREEENFLTMEEKKNIAEIILSNIVFFNAEGITCVEFVNVVKSIPEFTFAFHFKFL